MKLFYSRSFISNYQHLPGNTQKQIDKQIKLLIENPHHFSLNIKKMNDPREIWEGRVSAGYRFTFQIRGDVYILRKVGSHDILHNP